MGKASKNQAEQEEGSLTPPPKRNRKACSFLDQHSNFSNLGKSTCHLAKCNFAHIDAWNYADGVIFIRIHQSHERIGREIRVSRAGTRGKPSHLSDQDLLAEVGKDSFTMAHHNIVAFDLWYVQSDICQKRAQEVMENNMSYNTKAKPWRPLGKVLLANVGAIPLSTSFVFTSCAQNLPTKKAGWVENLKMSEWDRRAK